MQLHSACNRRTISVLDNDDDDDDNDDDDDDDADDDDDDDYDDDDNDDAHLSAESRDVRRVCRRRTAARDAETRRG